MDTKQAEANTENLIQATNNEKIRRGLILANIRYQDAMEELTRNQADAKKLEFGQITQGIKNLEKAWEQLDANIEGIKMDNKVKKETIFFIVVRHLYQADVPLLPAHRKHLDVSRKPKRHPKTV